jgi:TupA-like ATPgrasp
MRVSTDHRRFRDAWGWWRTLRRNRRKYREVFGRRMHLLFPRTHSEWIQHYKFLRRDAWLPPLTDKIDAKDFIARRVGEEFVIPTYWTGRRLPPRRVRRRWPRPYFIKVAHGCHQNVQVPAGGRVRWDRIEPKLERWMDATYGEPGGEWQYARLPKRLIVEQRVGESGVLPDDWKFWVFQGRVHYVHWFTDRGLPTYGGRIVDRDWNEPFRSVSQRTHERYPPRPESLDTMMWLAETLGEGFRFVRVDLYEVDGRPYVGELTFTPSAGFHTLDPDSADFDLGKLWREPRHERFPATPRPPRARAARARTRERVP